MPREEDAGDWFDKPTWWPEKYPWPPCTQALPVEWWTPQLREALQGLEPHGCRGIGAFYLEWVCNRAKERFEEDPTPLNEKVYYALFVEAALSS